METTEVIGEVLWEHRDHTSRRIDTRTTEICLVIEGCSLSHVLTHIGDMDTEEIVPSLISCYRDRIIEIPSICAIDRDRRPCTEIETFSLVDEGGFWEGEILEFCDILYCTFMTKSTKSLGGGNGAFTRSFSMLDFHVIATPEPPVYRYLIFRIFHSSLFTLHLIFSPVISRPDPVLHEDYHLLCLEVITSSKILTESDIFLPTEFCPIDITCSSIFRRIGECDIQYPKSIHDMPSDPMPPHTSLDEQYLSGSSHEVDRFRFCEFTTTRRAGDDILHGVAMHVATTIGIEYKKTLSTLCLYRGPTMRK